MGGVNFAKKWGNSKQYSIEMHMDKAYIDQYDLEELEEKCTLVLSDGLQEMRENMICKEKSELLICGSVK